MKVAIMQPYFFPYIGYFQLIQNADKFVFYDDVNYIKGGWINRNRIFLNGQPLLFTLPISKASPNKKINELIIISDSKPKKKLLKTFEQAYRKAPEYGNVMPIIKDIIDNNENNLSKYVVHSILTISSYLDLNTEFIRSSSLIEVEAKGQERIISICKFMKASVYINLIGGKDLYQKEAFNNEGIELHFLKPGEIEYNQGLAQFVPNLSIIDVMMFNSQEKVKSLLNKIRLY